MTPAPEFQLRNRMNLWPIGLIILLATISMVEGGIIFYMKHSPAGQQGLLQRILPKRWIPAAIPRERPNSPTDRIVLWESAQDIEAIHDRINRLFSALTIPRAPLHPLLSNPAPTRNSAGPATDSMLQVQQEINRIFESAFIDTDIFSLPSRLDNSWAGCAISSSMQVEDGENNIVVQMALPGLDPSAMAISLQGQLLTITVNPPAAGQASPGGPGRTDACVPREHLETKIMLPGPVDASAAKATYREDILRIEIPKSTEKEPLARTIKVI